MHHSIKKVEPLHSFTQQGLFETCDGVLVWVVGWVTKFAIQLEECDERPAFSWCELDARPVAWGKSLGPVELVVGDPVDLPFRARTGLIVYKNCRCLLKVNEEHGGSRRLYIRWDHRRYSQDLTYYPHWQLQAVIDGERCVLFESPEELPQLRTYLRLNNERLLPPFVAVT